MSDAPAPLPPLPGPPLPVDAVLPALVAALRTTGRAVLVAPPGAGKTTRVPLALLAAGVPGRILMLEPRRIAARAAAERMAASLDSRLGDTVGYRIRGDAAISAATRIEVVTEGILTRMIQSDPALTGVGAVIFDEFHERALTADLGLALAWDLRCGLREDLWLVVMSATMDAAPVAGLLDDAPVLTATGRMYPVETRWLDRPLAQGPSAPHGTLERAVAAAVRTALSAGDGDAAGGILVFLPGEAQIHRVASLLSDLPPPDRPGGIALHRLYGAMALAAQRAAIAPDGRGRKLVLATAIAETSITIEGVSVVIDAGRARRARYDPASGMSRLVTERVSRAEADQRAGRAGRTGPGLCYRLWTRAEDRMLAAFAPPEIALADLAPLALDLAAWGAGPDQLAFLTPPPAPAMAEARLLLEGLGALDAQGQVTPEGRALAALPLHPRLGHMLRQAGRAAAPLAALLSARDPLPDLGTDLAQRLARLSRPGRDDSPAVAAVRAESARLARAVAEGDGAPGDPGAMAALAYPDRIAQPRSGGGDPATSRFLLSGGKGAWLPATDPLARAAFLVATDLDGDPRESRIRQAAPLDEARLRATFAARIIWSDVVAWSRRDGRVIARRQERLGALVLADRPLADPAPADLLAAALDGLRDLGLPWSEAALRLRARIRLLLREGAALPPVEDADILAHSDWLAPHLAGARTAADLRRTDMVQVLRGAMGRDGVALLDRLAPAAFTTPLGRAVPIDYDSEYPGITLRLQEVFGVSLHPVVGPRRLPLRLTLLSPGQKPVQVTTDLPGFWDTSYADVRRDMRGRYPRHPWPEDPRQAAPTLRAKPRGT